ncbi:MAG: hypothetical protein FJX19_11615 [Alphaproteobacteria bacterium]|nr:hypothetical protein [Alphaproteobacteria bacterium]
MIDPLGSNPGWAPTFSAFPDLAVPVAAYRALARLAGAIEARPAVAAVLAAEGVEATAFSAPRIA